MPYGNIKPINSVVAVSREIQSRGQLIFLFLSNGRGENPDEHVLKDLETLRF